MKVKIDGVDQLIARCQSNHLLAGPLRDAMNSIGLLGLSEARKRSPVDTGRMRASHSHRLDAAPVPLWVQIGPNTNYAEFVHNGTKFMRARPWLAQTLREQKTAFVGIITKAGQQIAAKWGN